MDSRPPRHRKSEPDAPRRSFPLSDSKAPDDDADRRNVGGRPRQARKLIRSRPKLTDVLSEYGILVGQLAGEGREADRSEVVVMSCRRDLLAYRHTAEQLLLNLSDKGSRLLLAQARPCPQETPTCRRGCRADRAAHRRPVRRGRSPRRRPQSVEPYRRLYGVGQEHDERRRRAAGVCRTNDALQGGESDQWGRQGA